MTLFNELNGKLTVHFENEEFKEFYLRAVLKRPRINISMTDNSSLTSNNVLIFGEVNCESYKRLTMYLLNETDVDTKWQIHYKKHTLKSNLGFGTVTEEEKEDIQKTDDSSVFIFSVTEGVISGPSLPLINLPLGPGLPQVQNEYSNKYKPVKIEVMFKVILIKLYNIF